MHLQPHKRRWIRRSLAPAVAFFALALSGCHPQRVQVATAPSRPTPVVHQTVATLAAAPAPKAPASAAKPQPPDPVAQLVAASQKDYERGLQLYNDGHIDDARHAFDGAIDRLLTSNLDVRGNPVVSAQFDRLVDRIHALETEALKEGDGFTEQVREPAPIDAVAELTFPPDPNARAEVESKIRNTGGDLPLVLTDPVVQYIHYFSHSGREYLLDGFRHAGRYREMIERVLREEGLPLDLIYLAQAESGFRARSVSHKGADGIWQFMASRADDYDLKRNWWVDERQDPEKSTIAAARHLKDLYKQFGDWYLAMAAYDSGPGTVMHAVARTGYADFWELYKRGVLPKETRNYVPIIIATALIAKNPQQYGLNEIVEDQPEPTDVITLDAPLDLRLAAECAETTVDRLQQLNPSLLRMTTPNIRGFELRLPAGSKEKFEQSIALIPPDKRVLWRYHRVERGETVSDVARLYHSRATQILEVNNLGPHTLLQPGDQLVIPINTLPVSRTLRYRVHRGDTLRSVARTFAVSVSDIRRWNHFQGSRLRPGRMLSIHLPGSGSGETASSGGPRGRHKSHKTNNLQAKRQPHQQPLSARHRDGAAPAQ